VIEYKKEPKVILLSPFFILDFLFFIVLKLVVFQTFQIQNKVVLGGITSSSGPVSQ
jgi:hypothetical protein